MGDVIRLPQGAPTSCVIAVPVDPSALDVVRLLVDEHVPGIHGFNVPCEIELYPCHGAGGIEVHVFLGKRRIGSVPGPALERYRRSFDRMAELGCRGQCVAAIVGDDTLREHGEPNQTWRIRFSLDAPGVVSNALDASE